MLLPRDDEWRSHLNGTVAQTGQSQCGLLKQTFRPREAQELFGKAGARQGPQAGARATAEDDGCNLNHAFWTFWPSVSMLPISTFNASISA